MQPAREPAILRTADNDVLIYIFSFFDPPEIVSMRQTCKRLYTISKLRIVWVTARSIYISGNGFPFPDVPPFEDMSELELEYRTLYAYRLGLLWKAGFTVPAKRFDFDAASTAVTDLRFIPGHEKLLLTVSKSVWSAITIWDIISARKRLQWSPRGAVFSGFCLNKDPKSEATIAVSIVKDGKATVEVLSMDVSEEDVSLNTLFSVSTSFRPITLQGDLLALSDDVSQTAIWNWRKGTYATLRHLQLDGHSLWQNDPCTQVVFAHQSVLVVRARSIYLFPKPDLIHRGDEPVHFEPFAQHSFGWVDSVSVATRYQPREIASNQAISIFIRTKSDNYWSSNNHSLELYVLRPNPNFAPPLPSDSQQGSLSSAPPYLFPPVLESRILARHGPLRCPDVILGRSGTAIWIQPQDRAHAGLLWDDGNDISIPSSSVEDSCEALITTVFPGPLHPSTNSWDAYGSSNYSAISRKLGINELNNWASIDYDETLGRIALGSSYGKVSVLKI